jgi:FAD:protein FMN transferase
LDYTKVSTYLFLVVFLLSCGQNKKTQSKLYVFGTIVDIIIYNEDKKKAQQAIIDISRLFNELHHIWHAWDKKSELVIINNKIRTGQQEIMVSNKTIKALKIALQLERDSLGYFNPTIGKLIQKWGFLQDDFYNQKPPDDKMIRDLLKNDTSLEQVIIKENKIIVKNSNIQFDFGAFGKGLALDHAIVMLKKRKIKNALINAGGDVNVLGKKRGRSWIVAIKSPFDGSAIKKLKIDGEKCIYTSGNYERLYTYKNKKYHHLINPKNGKPADKIAAVSVIGNKGVLCDAAATALLIAPANKQKQIAKNFNLLGYHIVYQDGREASSNIKHYIF